MVIQIKTLDKVLGIQVLDSLIILAIQQVILIKVMTD